jgi:exopolyphosphatase/guanosine-5'-triphosphate,3'-diphosphate pyrophosphatase
MQLGAIDIGSNAARILIATAHEYDGKWHIHRDEYMRYPLRLGEDVFSDGKISEKKIEKFVKLMTAFKLLFEVFEVADFKACATSAMRDAKNGTEVVSHIEKLTGIKINIIEGHYEAELVDKAFFRMLDDKNYLHVDVGGGSTEINLISGNKKIASRSFNLGGVRALKGGNTEAEWEELKQWIKANIKDKYHRLHGLGTGGNIRKMYEMLTDKTDEYVPLNRLIELKDMISKMSIEERMGKLKLNADRADVIIPAADIYCKILDWSDCDRIRAPMTGLVDGIVYELFEKQIQKV